MKPVALPWPSLGHLLEAAARDHGEKPFLIFEGRTLGFGAADREVNRRANLLRRLGVRQGEAVALMLPNGFEFPLLWLSIAKLGDVMVPVNIHYREHDLAYILADSEARTIVVDVECLPVLERVRPKLARLERVVVAGAATPEPLDLAALAAAESEAFAIEGVGEHDLLNIQYTSGTTGFPKGCRLTHRYWLMLGRVASEVCAFAPDDVDLTAQPFTYMDPQWNLVLCLMHGIPLVVLRRFSPSRFWQAVKAHGVTFFYVIGTMPFYLLKQPPDPELEQRHRLRLVVCSGIVPRFHALFEAR